jgi:3-deoxy-D-manno-octulosonic-acid transferase
MRFIYIVLAYLLVPFAFGAVLWRGLRDREYWLHLGERFGFGRRVQAPPSIWVHAVSVGEVQVAAELVRSLLARHPGIPLVLTTATPTGAQRARALFGESAHVRYLPYDLPGSVRRFFDRVQPRLGVILETELWPNLYRECDRRRIPLVLANARISPRSLPRYRRLLPLFRDVLSSDIVIAAQTAADAERFVSIGANPTRTHITGNIKFDLELPEPVLAAGRQLREQYAPDLRSSGGGRGGEGLIWIAGSTHDGEEQIVLDAHREVRKSVRDALLLLAPRHRNRFETVAILLKRRGVPFVTRSSGAPATPQTEVLLIDTLGELLMFYAAADVAFIGGSLMPVGGHNLLEPAALSLPVLTGPHNFNSPEIARLLLDVGAAREVRNAAELATQVVRLLTNPHERERIGKQGRKTLDGGRGALQRLLALIEPTLR